MKWKDFLSPFGLFKNEKAVLPFYYNLCDKQMNYVVTKQFEKLEKQSVDLKHDVFFQFYQQAQEH